MLSKKLLFALSMFSVLPACGKSSGDAKAPAPTTEAIDSLIVVGTRVDAEVWHSRSEFTLVAVPKSAAGNAILNSAVVPKVTMEKSGLDTQAIVDAVNAPDKSKELAIALNIDASGSMASSDPDNLRISGASAFFDVLEKSAKDRTFSASLFAFDRFADVGPKIFEKSVLLQDFTNDLSLLKTGLEKIPAYGSTPTYDSLSEVMTYLNDKYPKDKADRNVVFFSDGAPNENLKKTEKDVCEEAKKLDIRIFAIGLGQASDLTTSPSKSAIQTMRRLSDCSGGAYAGVKPINKTTGVTDEGESASSAMDGLYTAVATAATDGSINIKVTVNKGVDIDLLEAEILKGNLTIVSGGTESTAAFSFSVPGAPEVDLD